MIFQTAEIRAVGFNRKLNKCVLRLSENRPFCGLNTNNAIRNARDTDFVAECAALREKFGRNIRTDVGDTLRIVVFNLGEITTFGDVKLLNVGDNRLGTGNLNIG